LTKIIYNSRVNGGTKMIAVNDKEIESVFLERKIYQKMLEWKKNLSKGHALFLKGSRRVGKTELAKKLGNEEYRSYLLIDFRYAPKEIKDLFSDSMEDLDFLFTRLQSFYGVVLYPGESLVILDEIQLCIEARQDITKFVSDGRYDYCETGSLAGIHRNSKKIVTPVGEYPLEVRPLDFEEFLWAIGDDVSMPFLRSAIKHPKQPIGKAMHAKLTDLWRQYMLVGGMPKPVAGYKLYKNLEVVDFLKQEILSIYKNDFDDQNEVSSALLHSIISAIPAELSKHDARFVESHIAGGRYERMAPAFKWLNDAYITNMSYGVSDPSASFGLTLCEDDFKAYFVDTGLLVSLTFIGKPYISNELYNKILFDKIHINEGMLAENIVAQCLKSTGHSLLFYSKYDEAGHPVMEIDFLCEHEGKVCPIETKSSKDYGHASLEKFKTAFSNRVGKQYILYDKDIKVDGEILYLPIYMAPILAENLL